jgi:pyruvate/2-oxoglutarate dehydrogenase complex dihydrolipoamide dehydrogenase (E3) component
MEEKGVPISRNEVKIGDEVLRADKLLIATGSSPNTFKFRLTFDSLAWPENSCK